MMTSKEFMHCKKISVVNTVANSEQILSDGH